MPLVFLLPSATAGGGPSPRAAESPWASWGSLLANPSFRLLLAYFTLPAIAGWVIRDWMPSVLRA